MKFLREYTNTRILFLSSTCLPERKRGTKNIYFFNKILTVEAYTVQLFCKTKLRLYLKGIAVKFLDKTRSEWPNPKKGRNSIMHRLGKGNGLTSKTLGVHKNTRANWLSQKKTMWRIRKEVFDRRHFPKKRRENKPGLGTEQCRNGWMDPWGPVNKCRGELYGIYDLALSSGSMTALT